MHYLLSTLLDAVSDYDVTPPVNPDNTAPELWRFRALTIFSEFCFATAIWTLAATNFSSCLQTCSRAWHPWGLSLVWLHVLRMCVCISVFDSQLNPELHFRGRVKNNAFKQSCTTFCPPYFAPAPCTLMVTMTLLACVYACWHNHKSNAIRGSTILKHTSTQAVLILCGDVCYLAYARWSYITADTCTFRATSFSSCLQACSRAWYPWGLLPV
jgi:uncharacterized CHY-type Zn-finger protein